MSQYKFGHNKTVKAKERFCTIIWIRDRTFSPIHLIFGMCLTVTGSFACPFSILHCQFLWALSVLRIHSYLLGLLVLRGHQKESSLGLESTMHHFCLGTKTKREQFNCVSAYTETYNMIQQSHL